MLSSRRSRNARSPVVIYATAVGEITMGDQPVEVTLHLSRASAAPPRRRARPARARRSRSTSFVARAIAEQDAPPDAAPGRHMDAPAPQPGLVWPGAAAALELHRGDVVRIEQVAGGQCVDLVAWSLPDPRERLSAARTRAIAGISPGTGDEPLVGAALRAPPARADRRQRARPRPPVPRLQRRRVRRGRLPAGAVVRGRPGRGCRSVGSRGGRPARPAQPLAARRTSPRTARSGGTARRRFPATTSSSSRTRRCS